MADIEYIIPGSGIVNDTEEGAEVIIPGFGIYQEQEAAAGGLSIPRPLSRPFAGPLGGI